MGTGLNPLSEQQVNFSPSSGTDGVVGTQADPAVAALANGDFVVVYDNAQAIESPMLHYFDPNGKPIDPPGPSGLNGVIIGGQFSVHPAVAATPDGGYVLAVTNTSVADNSIVVDRYDNATGASASLIIDTGAGPLHQPNVGPVDSASIGAFADGTSVVVWEFTWAADPLDHDLYFAFLNSTGNGFVRTPLPLAVQNGFEGEARVATSGDLAAIVYAADPGHKQGDQDIILRLFNSSATEVAAPSTIFGAASLDVFSHPDVAALSDGRFVIVAQDDTTSALLASLYDPVTHAVTPLLNIPGVLGAGTNPHVAGAPDGGFVVSFDDPSGDVVEARFGPGGSVLFNAGFANSFTAGAQDENAIAANAGGTVFIAWQDASAHNPVSFDADTRIQAQAFRLQEVPQPNFNGDLHSDILWQNSNGQASVWEMNGNTLIGGGLVSPNPGPAWKAVGTGDFFGGGESDILWRNASSGQVSIWEMNGNSLVGGGPVSPNPGPAWQAIGTGDFNHDGHSDILFQNTSGQASIWEMDGNKLIGGGPVSPNPGPAWKAVGTGDFFGGGDSDILFQNTSSGQVSIWEMNGNSLAGGGPVSPNPGPSWKAIGTGDFNGDGLSDILFQNTSSGQVSIWEMSGTTLMGGGTASPNPGPAWRAVGTGDFNGDGFSDILFQNTSGQATIWEMNGTHLAGGGPVSPNPGPSWRAVV